MTIELVEYIKSNGIDKLCQIYSIDAKRHGQYNNLVLLKYSMIDSPMNERVVQQARGIILDEANDWAVVCRSYNKFFNYGEGHAAKIDWKTARVYEKLDGSLVQLYHYDSAWRVATSGMPDAVGQVNDFGYSFADLFWKVWEELGYVLPSETNKCYAFELMTPYNRTVVPYQNNAIVLHGCRDLTTMLELDPVLEAQIYGWTSAMIYALNTIEAIEEASKHLDPMLGEGYVVCDGDFNRIKVKSPKYVALHHLKDSVGTSKKSLLELARNNEGSEFLSYFKEYTEDYLKIKSELDGLVGEMKVFYEGIKDLSDRKTFALTATTKPYSDAMFRMKYKGLVSFEQYLAEMNIKHLQQLLGMREDA